MIPAQQQSRNDGFSVHRLTNAQSFNANSDRGARTGSGGEVYEQALCEFEKFISDVRFSYHRRNQFEAIVFTDIITEAKSKYDFRNITAPDPALLSLP